MIDGASIDPLSSLEVVRLEIYIYMQYATISTARVHDYISKHLAILNSFLQQHEVLEEAPSSC